MLQKAQTLAQELARRREEVLLGLWERVLAVNLMGPFLACRRAIPLFLEQGGGSIVNTALEAALGRGAAGTSYTVSKHGVVGLTCSIAFHYGERGIRCNAVCPGAVATAIGVGNSVPSAAGLARVRPFLEGSAPRASLRLKSWPPPLPFSPPKRPVISMKQSCRLMLAVSPPDLPTS